MMNCLALEVILRNGCCFADMEARLMMSHTCKTANNEVRRYLETVSGFVSSSTSFSDDYTYYVADSDEEVEVVTDVITYIDYGSSFPGDISGICWYCGMHCRIQLLHLPGYDVPVSTVCPTCIDDPDFPFTCVLAVSDSEEESGI